MQPPLTSLLLYLGFDSAGQPGGKRFSGARVCDCISCRDAAGDGHVLAVQLSKRRVKRQAHLVIFRGLAHRASTCLVRSDPTTIDCVQGRQKMVMALR